jgi:hypothetical protein
MEKGPPGQRNELWAARFLRGPKPHPVFTPPRSLLAMFAQAANLGAIRPVLVVFFVPLTDPCVNGPNRDAPKFPPTAKSLGCFRNRSHPVFNEEAESTRDRSEKSHMTIRRLTIIYLTKVIDCRTLPPMRATSSLSWVYGMQPQRAGGCASNLSLLTPVTSASEFFGVALVSSRPLGASL